MIYNLRSIACKFNCCRETTEDIIVKLQSDLKLVLEWFGSDPIMVNPVKFQYMSPGRRKSLKIEIEGFKLESEKYVKLLGLTIDHNMTFHTHIPNICKAASAKIKSLSRIRNGFDEKQAKLLHNSFLLSI